MPTELKWKLPPGWKIGDIQWPIPLKTIDPGDIETYGYENEVLLLQEITPPSKLDDSSAKLSTEANWLVCEKICIPGSATLQLDLPVASTSQPANTDVFARYRRLLPQNLAGPDVARADWSRVGSDLRLKITGETLAKYPAVDFFPLPEQET
ncbi:MAG: protein-disulfide reductase DsbD domain-containing protein, partial [Bacteroidia bacterium]